MPFIMIKLIVAGSRTFYDPVTGWPVYEGDTCEVYYDSASCPWYPPLEDVPF